MRDRTRTRWCARWVCGVTALALTFAGCSADDEPSPEPESTDSTSTSAAPTSGAPEPAESAKLYTQSRPSSSEGRAATANKAVRSFAEAISSGDRKALDEGLHVPTPQDPSIIDQTVRTFEDVTWDEGSLRWSDSGFLGPCYLLMGEGKDGPVHLAGTAVWNDVQSEWEFTTDGFPGSADYPELPTC